MDRVPMHMCVTAPVENTLLSESLEEGFIIRAMRIAIKFFHKDRVKVVAGREKG